MLYGISKLISPELIKVLMEMGHGDEIVLADGNFPAMSHGATVIRADGHGMVPLLEEILKLFPLDAYVEKPAALMQVVQGDTVETPIWDQFVSIFRQHTSLTEPFEHLDRFAFYERARKACAVVATGEGAQYANIILKKGVITE
ncbi:L-fucose mutarotase [Alicyclobacillus fastidiosus]|uniref:L-fucose mutarotase n=1 Tax=Alicyclobacillus fastidiosus TaxID=392011 RepID=A0ABY6ZAG0_9BACL|nr:L-fucose mutarotase [Alicyclobacillus fastidiosus]WAH39827.1 L-fucose mutarotase [Alicyclobacillus fastidiosus]GMA61084.1 fucose isomerase [Alicyclobacillus fastidiosus]